MEKWNPSVVFHCAVLISLQPVEWCVPPNETAAITLSGRFISGIKSFCYRGVNSQKMSGLLLILISWFFSPRKSTVISKDGLQWAPDSDSRPFAAQSRKKPVASIISPLPPDDQIRQGSSLESPPRERQVYNESFSFAKPDRRSMNGKRAFGNRSHHQKLAGRHMSWVRSIATSPPRVHEKRRSKLVLYVAERLVQYSSTFDSPNIGIGLV